MRAVPPLRAWTAAILVAMPLFLLSTSRGAPLDEAMARLTARLAEQIKPGATPHTDNRAAQAAMLLARLQNSIDRRHWDDALSQLGYFDSALRTETAVEIIQLIHEVRLEVLKQKDAIDQSIPRRIDEAVNRAVARCRDATEPADLDASIRELSELRSTNTFQPAHLRSTFAKLNLAAILVARMQDALVLEAAGKPEEAAAKIKELSEKTDAAQLVDRSELLARVDRLRAKAAASPPPAATGTDDEALVASVTTFAQLDEVFAGLERRRASAAENQKLRELLEQVKALRRARDELRAGHYGAAANAVLGITGATSVMMPNLIELQQEVLAALLPHYLARSEVPARRPGEPVADLLQRVIAEANARQDWRTALRALETLQLFVYRFAAGPAWLSCDLRAYSAVVIAAEQENAGLLEDAAAGYKGALGCASQNLPVAWVTGRLKALGDKRQRLPRR